MIEFELVLEVLVLDVVVLLVDVLEALTTVVVVGVGSFGAGAGAVAAADATGISNAQDASIAARIEQAAIS